MLLRSVVGLLMLPGAVAAQSALLLRPPEDRFVALELLHPHWDRSNISWYSGSAFLTLRTRLNPGLALVADLPFFLLRAVDTSSGVGNPYIALEFTRPGRSLSFETGGRLPIASREDAFPRTLVSWADYDRFEAFASKLLTLWGIMHVAARSQTGVLTTFRAGLVHRRASDSGDYSDNNIAYGFGLAYAPASTSVGASITGRWNVSASNAGLANATTNQLGLGLRTRWGQFQPGVQLRIPLDREIRDDLKLTLGLSLLAELR